MSMMLKPAFSTVACPDWLLREVAERALKLGFEAVELRTFGDDSRRFACDPAMTGEAKVRSMFLERGVEISSLATGVRFDEPVWPPVVGYFSDHVERAVREGKRAVDLAVGLECPLVRVFGFEFPAREKRAAAISRIARRLGKVVDHADKSGVRVVVENGGSFATADELLELIAAVNQGYFCKTGEFVGPVDSGVAAANDEYVFSFETFFVFDGVENVLAFKFGWIFDIQLLRNASASAKCQKNRLCIVLFALVC
ncbi:MAG: sugar phosphate isomerase/epimerase, partial [Phycisphaerales bacterium]|nr:sugar phosphate isomerase/epimerase [Phycisphaerales bacterium]